MFRHEIPNHLDVQDRLVAGLTARQLALVLCGLTLAHGAWSRLEHVAWLPLAARAAAAVAVAACFLAIALVRPQGTGLDRWAFALLRHATAPAVCVWRPGAAEGAPAQPPEHGSPLIAASGGSDFERAWRSIASSDPRCAG